MLPQTLDTSFPFGIQNSATSNDVFIDSIIELSLDTSVSSSYTLELSSPTLSWPITSPTSHILVSCSSIASIVHIPSYHDNDIHIAVDLLVQGIHKMNGFSNKNFMNTRSNTGVFKPRAFNASLILLEPKTWKYVVNVSKWKDAMQKEFNALLKNRTQKLISLPIRKKTIK